MAKEVSLTAIVVDLEDGKTVEFDKPITEFLANQKKTTRFTYVSQFKLFVEFTKMNGEQLLDSKRSDKTFEWEKRIFAFRDWLLEKDYSEHYAKSTTGCVRGFFSFHREQLKFRRSEAKRLSEANRTTEDYLFDKEDLGKMSMCGNLKERYVSLVGKSLGLRAEDFIRLTFGKFRGVKLDLEAPIFIGETPTRKESVKAYPFLDSDAIPIVKAILEANPQAKDTDRILSVKEEELSVILQTLAKKSGIQNGSKHVRFHVLRKYLIDRLSAYASESQWKQIVGKKIEEKAYVSTDQLRQIYHRAMKDIAINGNGKNIKKLEELTNALIESQKRISALETTNEALRQKLGELETDRNTMHKSILDLTEDMATVKNKLKIKERVKVD